MVNALTNKQTIYTGKLCEKGPPIMAAVHLNWPVSSLQLMTIHTAFAEMLTF